MNPTGPLNGVKVIEIQGIGPGPFAAMMLAKLGANVLRVGRPGSRSRFNPVLDQGRCGQVNLDLKQAQDKDALLDLIGQSDVLIEGYRPGVMERLGLGPDECLARNPRLVYGRITGWGRQGPLAHTAGHDINYVALSGALHGCGTAESGPVPPLNLVGDFGGGAMLLVAGIACALFESKVSGKGQVVDAAITDGTALLMSMIYGFRASERWTDRRANNILDGSAYFYTCYRCADGEWVAVGAIEPEFRQQLFKGLGLEAEASSLMRASDQDAQVRQRIAAIFENQPRAHWQRIFEGTDACVTPVLSVDEAPSHEYNQSNDSLRLVDGVIQPIAAPRFSRSGSIEPGQCVDIDRLKTEWKIDRERIVSVG